jgi:hypothetical protein
MRMKVSMARSMKWRSAWVTSFMGTPRVALVAGDAGCYPERRITASGVGTSSPERDRIAAFIAICNTGAKPTQTDSQNRLHARTTPVNRPEASS